MSHIYKKVPAKDAKKERVPTVREMVTEWGDNWRTLVMHDNGYKFGDQYTFDEMEAVAMRFMEDGTFPRIRSQDLCGE